VEGPLLLLSFLYCECSQDRSDVSAAAMSMLEATANKTMKNRKIKPQKDTKI
jgi:hypothetical protein